jgi:hypothetical protein
MPRQIFRKEALDQLASPEQLDQLMPITSPRGWWALAAVGLLLALSLVWSVFGRVKTQAEAEGVLRRPADLTAVQSPVTGTVTRLLVSVGDEVKKGQVLVELRARGSAANTNPVLVLSPSKGRVVDFVTNEGTTVGKGDPLLSIENPERPPQAIVYIPATEGYRIQSGMKVEVQPATAVRRYMRYLPGQVIRTSRLPASRDAMFRVLKRDEWVNTLLQSGPLLEVIVELAEVNPEILSGTPCRAFVTTSEQRPIEFVFPSSHE